jgi:hypothetical protein
MTMPGIVCLGARPLVVNKIKEKAAIASATNWASASAVAVSLPLEALVCLNDHDDIVLRTVDDTDIRFCMSPSTTDKEGDVLATASHAMAPDVTECLEEFDGEIDHCRLLETRKHHEIEQVDKLGVVVIHHEVCILAFGQRSVVARRAGQRRSVHLGR